MISSETLLNITMHTKGVDGVWCPVIVDPMSDSELENQATHLLITQRAERQALIRQGESVAG